MSPFRLDGNAAASTVVAFMMASVVFLGSVAGIMAASRDAGASNIGDAGIAAGSALQAKSLAEILLESPGVTVVGGQFLPWAGNSTSADSLVRLGLRSSNNMSLDFEAFQNLRRAPYFADPNDKYVNYEEARKSLGLNATNRDFHVRAFPSLKSVQEILNGGIRDQNMRVTYIGHAESVTTGNNTDPAAGLGVSAATCTVRSDGKAYTISNNVTNGGTASVQFSGIYNVDLLVSGTEAFVDRTRSYLIPGSASAPNNVVTLSIDVPHKAGRSCQGAVINFEVWDIDKRLGPVRVYNITSGSAAPTAVTRDLWLNPSSPYSVKNNPITFDFDGNLPTKNSDPVVPLQFSIRDANGTLTYGPEQINVTRKIRSVTVPASAFVSGTNFVANLTDPAGGAVTRDPVLVLPSGQTPAPYVPSGSATTQEPTTSMAIEIGYLDSLVEKFCPYNYDSNSVSLLPNYNSGNYSARCGFKAATTPVLSPAQPGDVFTDVRTVMNNALPERLMNAAATGYEKQCSGGGNGGAPRYDIARVLVVGSNVDHNAMTSGAAKHAVCEWVMGGGTLIVFGSSDQQANWLQPIFHAAIRSSSTGISTPDASHPVLTRSDPLAYDGYASHGVWRFNGQTAGAQSSETTQLFTNVVVNGPDPVLTISDPGAFGDGTVILTTWLPYDLFGTGPGTGTTGLEGRLLLNNLLMQGYRDLFLDYGPAIPTSSRQAPSAERIVEIWHPEFDHAITLTVFVYVF